MWFQGFPKESSRFRAAEHVQPLLDALLDVLTTFWCIYNHELASAASDSLQNSSSGFQFGAFRSSELEFWRLRNGLLGSVASFESSKQLVPAFRKHSLMLERSFSGANKCSCSCHTMDLLHFMKKPWKNRLFLAFHGFSCGFKVFLSSEQPSIPSPFWVLCWMFWWRFNASTTMSLHRQPQIHCKTTA